MPAKVSLERARNAIFRRSINVRKYVLGARRQPAFIIGGAQKAGTTFLFDVLVRQLEFSGPTTKEIHFFSSEWSRGLKWYLAHFDGINSKKQQIEGSASYIFHPAAAARFAETLPQGRIVFILRDPVARAYSHYHHNLRRRNRENLSFFEALRAEDDRIKLDRAALTTDQSASVLDFYKFSYAERGKYALQLSRWYEALGKDRILLVDSARLFEGDEAELSSITAFFEAKIDWSVVRFARTNSGRYDKIEREAYCYLKTVFAPHDEMLCDLTGRKWSWM